ncbi:MAG: 30S ribosome-binding factor RbfA [Planctomycetes bacterium]|nr:30S ribosome-binding factor RbfA [Planctomycetota bacterium]
MKRFRKERLASVIRDVVAEAIQHRLNDPRVSPLTSVTRVEMISDVQFADVFVSVPGGDVQERKTLAAIKHAAGFIQRLVARELSIRQCPELRFDIDERVKMVRQMLDLLEKNRRGRSVQSVDDAGMPDLSAADFEPKVPGSGNDCDDGDRRIDE